MRHRSGGAPVRSSSERPHAALPRPDGAWPGEPPGARPDGDEPRPEDVIAFPDGLPGFEACRRFVLLSSSELAPFSVLRALDPPAPAFLLIDPVAVLARYRRVLAEADRRRLQADDQDALLWLAIVSVGGDRSASVNLRAPIVINPRLMIGCQVMPHESLYPLRHPLTL